MLKSECAGKLVKPKIYHHLQELFDGVGEMLVYHPGRLNVERNIQRAIKKDAANLSEFRRRKGD